jgi:hypothetical protein
LISVVNYVGVRRALIFETKEQGWMAFSSQFLDQMKRERMKRERIGNLVDSLEAGHEADHSSAVNSLLDLCLSEEYSFKALHALLKLRKGERLSGAEVQSHVPQILSLCDSTLGKVRSFQQDGPGNEWTLDDQYRPTRSLAGLILDLLGYLGGDSINHILREAAALRDLRLRMFAMVSLLRRLEPVSPTDFEPVAASDETRILLWRELRSLHRTELMPEQWSTPEQLAASDLVNWAASPMELGVAPQEIDLMFRQPFEDRQGRVFDAFLYRFREHARPEEPGEGWMAGVAGPYLDGEAMASPWSSFERWDSRTPEEHFERLFQRASRCGRGNSKS